MAIPVFNRLRSPLPSEKTVMSTVEKALVKAGIEFIPESDRGEGVRLARPDSPTRVAGRTRARRSAK